MQKITALPPLLSQNGVFGQKLPGSNWLGLYVERNMTRTGNVKPDVKPP